MLKLIALLLSCLALNGAELPPLPPTRNESVNSNAQAAMRAYHFQRMAEANLRLSPMRIDPVKTSLTNVQAAIKTLVAVDVAATLQTHTNHAEMLAYHFRRMADVFTAMPLDGTFSVEHLNAQLADNLLPPELQDSVRALASDVQTAIVTVYARAYAHRGRAGIPPMEFLASVSQTFREAINDGIRRGGKAYVAE